MHPFQAYQNIGHGSTSLPQNTQYSYENVTHDFFPAASTTTQAEYHNNMLNHSKIFQTNTSNDILSSTPNEPYKAKGYTLNIPQLSTEISQKRSSITQDLNIHRVAENSATTQNLQSSTGTGQNICTSEESDPNDLTSNLCADNKSLNELPGEQTNETDQNCTEIPENLTTNPMDFGITRNVSSSSPIFERTTNKNDNCNISDNSKPKNSLLMKCLSETKRISLEKTVRLIESIIVKSTTNSKPGKVENCVDPLAMSPNPENVKSEKASDSDSDNEVLIKMSKKKTPARKPIQRKSNTFPKNNIILDTKNMPIRKTLLRKVNTLSNITKLPETKSKLIDIEIEVENIKVEEASWADVEYENPFVRDSNGVYKESICDAKVISMENSVEEALATVKNGSTSTAYMECPHCSLLFLHPKRFLVHTKWHSFGLLNAKRAQLLREREERFKKKRAEMCTQRISPTRLAEDAAVPTFPCKDCEDVFPTKTSLKSHRRKTHRTPVTQCKVCLLPVQDMKSLRDHMETHEDKVAGGHQCPQCPKRFKFRHSLTKHADTHLEKTHSCPVCGKLFGSLALVHTHSKTHARAARGPVHRCAYCGKGFYETYNLHVHERTHRNDKPFKCDTCDSRFITNSSLKRHLKVSHSGAKPFTCPVCLKCFSSASIRDRHELRAHSDQRNLPCQCDLCPRRFVKQKDLRNHMYRVHKKDKTDVDAEQKIDSDEEEILS